MKLKTKQDKALELAEKHWNQHVQDNKIITTKPIPEIEEEIRTTMQNLTRNEATNIVVDHYSAINSRLKRLTEKQPKNPDIEKLRTTFQHYREITRQIRDKIKRK